MTKPAKELVRRLKELANPERAKANAWFFKTGPGEYGEGDRFLGVTMPQIRFLVKTVSELSLSDVKELLGSPYHEQRMLGLLLIVKKYEALEKNEKRPAVLRRERKRLVDFYLSQRAWINNWDLIDVTAPRIVGHYFASTNSRTQIRKLSKSSRHWDRRLAILSSFAFIRNRDMDLSFELAEYVIQSKDSEDLMHKATGWMLREAGKRDQNALRAFLQKHGANMPRTMLRYSIEKFSKSERAQILKSTR